MSRAGKVFFFFLYGSSRATLRPEFQSQAALSVVGWDWQEMGEADYITCLFPPPSLPRLTEGWPSGVVGRGGGGGMGGWGG